MKTLLYILSFIFFISCNQKNKKTDIFVYDLEATNEYLNIHLDDSTYIPLNNISYYQFDSSEYIAFVNKQTPQLIIYNISKGEIYKKIVYNIINVILEGIKLNNSKIEKLSQRTILLLEKTKKEYKKFAEERKQLYCYLVNKDDLIEWEKYVNKLEKKINE